MDSDPRGYSDHYTTPVARQTPCHYHQLALFQEETQSKAEPGSANGEGLSRGSLPSVAMESTVTRSTDTAG